MSTAPAMIYIMPENFTPAHRAQLVRSNKKLEQILGVTPSLLPIQPSSNTSHRRIRSMSIVPQSPSSQRTTRAKGRHERGKLSNIFKTTADPEEMPLARASSTSSADSVSTASTSHDDIILNSELPYHRDLTPKRLRRRNRPPHLNLSGDASPRASSSSASTQESVVLDISPPRSAVNDRIDVDSPLSPTFRLDLPNVPRIKKQEDEDDVLTDILNNSTYRCPADKRTKLSRLAKHFGTQPPLELVFPPSPTSQSRHNPKRYTYGLPPPFISGAVPESKMIEGLRGQEEHLDDEQHKNSVENDGKILQVFWDSVGDEKGRQRVMDALRELRA